MEGKWFVSFRSIAMLFVFVINAISLACATYVVYSFYDNITFFSSIPEWAAKIKTPEDFNQKFDAIAAAQAIGRLDLLIFAISILTFIIGLGAFFSLAWFRKEVLQMTNSVAKKATVDYIKEGDGEFFKLLSSNEDFKRLIKRYLAQNNAIREFEGQEDDDLFDLKYDIYKDLGNDGFDLFDDEGDK